MIDARRPKAGVASSRIVANQPQVIERPRRSRCAKIIGATDIDEYGVLALDNSHTRPRNARCPLPAREVLPKTKQERAVAVAAIFELRGGVQVDRGTIGNPLACLHAGRSLGQHHLFGDAGSGAIDGRERPEGSIALLCVFRQGQRRGKGPDGYCVRFSVASRRAKQGDERDFDGSHRKILPPERSNPPSCERAALTSQGIKVMSRKY